MCVCLWQRERERESGRERDIFFYLAYKIWIISHKNNLQSSFSWEGRCSLKSRNVFKRVHRIIRERKKILWRFFSEKQNKSEKTIWVQILRSMMRQRSVLMSTILAAIVTQSLFILCVDGKTPGWPSPYWDIPGDFCRARYREQRCCEGRNDPCSVPIMGTLCYCDNFCNFSLPKEPRKKLSGLKVILTIRKSTDSKNNFIFFIGMF